MPRLSAWCLVLLFACAASLHAQDRKDPQQLDRRPGAGEQCLVCGMVMQGDIEVVELRWKGRVFHIGAPLVEEFLADPERYFHKIQARAALFDEEGYGAGAMGSGWLILGIYVTIGLVFAALCGYLAVSHGLNPIPWFFAGLVGNVAALFVLFATANGDVTGVPAGLAKVPTTRGPRTCSACGHENHPAARSCIGCRSELEPAYESEARRLRGGAS